jgi:hypothetical protein
MSLRIDVFGPRIWAEKLRDPYHWTEGYTLHWRWWYSQWIAPSKLDVVHDALLSELGHPFTAIVAAPSHMNPRLYRLQTGAAVGQQRSSINFAWLATNKKIVGNTDYLPDRMADGVAREFIEALRRLRKSLAWLGFALDGEPMQAGGLTRECVRPTWLLKDGSL